MLEWRKMVFIRTTTRHINWVYLWIPNSDLHSFHSLNIYNRKLCTFCFIKQMLNYKGFPYLFNTVHNTAWNKEIIFPLNLLLVFISQQTQSSNNVAYRDYWKEIRKMYVSFKTNLLRKTLSFIRKSVLNLIYIYKQY